jgi:hypothetical protein
MRVRAVRAALGPAGAWWLKERVLGQLPVLTGHTVVGAGQPATVCACVCGATRDG